MARLELWRWRPSVSGYVANEREMGAFSFPFCVAPKRMLKDFVPRGFFVTQLNHTTPIADV